MGYYKIGIIIKKLLHFNKIIDKSYKMVNFKVPYFLYPVIIGVALGYLVSVVTTSIYTSPKPLPVPRVKKVEKEQIDYDKTALDIIGKNIFLLDTTPQVQAGNVNGSATSGSGITTTPDGAPLNPAPPFHASLIGIIYDEVNNTGIATIVLDSGTVSISLGHEKDGIKLVELNYSFANIVKDGKTYSLIIDNGAKVESSPSVPQTASPAMQTGVQIQDTGATINITVPRDELKNDLKDINQVLQSARVATFYEDGQFVGYRVAMLKPESPLLKLGLQVGDIITRINGSELTNPAALFNMFTQVDDISALNVDMLRNKEKKSLFVEIR